MDELSATDRCVKCGLCLPHCPTFALTGNEADSPRGRISLMQWLDDDTMEMSPGLLTHIDRCLQCGACEAMCPSKVPFGALMDATRARLAPAHAPGIIDRALNRLAGRLLASPRALRLTGPLTGGYRRLGLPGLLGKLPGKIGRLNRLLDARTPGATPSAAPGRPLPDTAPRLHLFPGCTGHALDPDTLRAAQGLLQALGFRAEISRRTACCGALQQHNGQPDQAAALAARNRAALDDGAPVISVASGCAAHLLNYDALDTGGESASFSSRVSEIMAFLAGRDPAGLCFETPEYPIGVYVPCTQRNALQQSQAIFEVLNWIPGLDVRHINPNGGCCGAAGSYMLTQPSLSDTLGNNMAERVLESGVRILVTTNIGCALQLRSQLRGQDAAPEIIHPATLLWRQLQRRETVSG